MPVPPVSEVIPVSVWFALPRFKAIAVVPTYKVELPRTDEGIVPVKPAAEIAAESVPLIVVVCPDLPIVTPREFVVPIEIVPSEDAPFPTSIVMFPEVPEVTVSPVEIVMLPDAAPVAAKVLIVVAAPTPPRIRSPPVTVRSPVRDSESVDAL